MRLAWVVLLCCVLLLPLGCAAEELGRVSYDMQMLQAVKGGDVGMLKMLLAKDPAGLGGPNERGALMSLAAGSGQVGVVDHLLRLGVCVHGEGILANDAPLLAAAASTKPGSAKVAGLLMSRGADARAKDKRGISAFDIAVMSTNIPVARLLAKRGARPGNHLIELDYAIERGDTRQAAALLSKYPFLAKASDPLGNTALSIAAMTGGKAAAECLILKGADVNAKNAIGMTPLDLALIRKHEDVVNLLRRYGGVSEVISRFRLGAI